MTRILEPDEVVNVIVFEPSRSGFTCWNLYIYKPWGLKNRDFPLKLLTILYSIVSELNS